MFDLSPPDDSPTQYNKSIIWKMGPLQDVNGFCPAKKASTIGMRGQKQGVVQMKISVIHPGYRMKMLRGKKSWK